VEPIVHFALPLAALLLLGLDLRKAVPLALLGILPDLDSLLLIHRSFSHSIIVLSLLFLTIFILIRHYRPAHQRTVLLGFLVVASHIFLDLGALTPIFWPIYPYNISISFSLNIVLGNGLGLSPILHVTQVPTDFSRVPGFDYPLFTEEGMLITAVLLLPTFYKLAKRAYEKRNENQLPQSNERATLSN
jgi:membrane-bound metal-dependent hydrolase YbcI (DUF457 family)